MTSASPFSRATGALLGASLCAGWIAHDLGMFATTGRPANALDILPASFVAAGIGALIGALLGKSWKAWGGLVALAVLGSILPGVLDLALARHWVWLPRAVFLLGLGFGVARLLQGALGVGIVRAGFSLGLLACVAKSVARHGSRELSVALGVLAFVLLLVSLVRSRRPRLALTAVALGACCWWFAGDVTPDARPTRGDLSPPPVAADGPNLIFLVLDTVRADHLATYGYERVTTPALDAFARDEATIYTNCRSTSPFTLPSHASMFTGLFPSEHYATRPGVSATPMREDVPTLAQRLRDAGYQTAGIVANDTYVSPVFELDRGFESFDDRGGGWVAKYMALGQLLGGDALRVGHLSHREATEITDTALAWLDEERRQGPFFLFLNYLDAHSPYHPREAFSELFEDRQPVDPLTPEGNLRKLLYDRELAYLDTQLARLFDGLRQRGLFDDAWLIVTSDHGEDFLDHDIIEHCWSLYDTLIHVPLYVKPPGGREKAVEDTPVSIAQLFGLTLRAAGLEPETPFPDHGFVGEWYPAVPVSDSYGPWVARTGFDVDASRVAWMADGRKWIVSTSGEVLAFDVEEDPGEERPLELSEEEQQAARTRATDWWSAHPLPDPPDTDLDEETLRQMKALGYG